MKWSLFLYTFRYHVWNGRLVVDGDDDSVTQAEYKVNINFDTSSCFYTCAINLCPLVGWEKYENIYRAHEFLVGACTPRYCCWLLVFFFFLDICSLLKLAPASRQRCAMMVGWLALWACEQGTEQTHSHRECHNEHHHDIRNIFSVQKRVYFVGEDTLTKSSTRRDIRVLFIKETSKACFSFASSCSHSRFMWSARAKWHSSSLVHSRYSWLDRATSPPSLRSWMHVCGRFKLRRRESSKNTTHGHSIQTHWIHCYVSRFTPPSLPHTHTYDYTRTWQVIFHKVHHCHWHHVNNTQRVAYNRQCQNSSFQITDITICFWEYQQTVYEEFFFCGKGV